ncbi:MAG: hypothetical protein AAF333_01810 [Planctomycetota bacterium]
MWQRYGKWFVVPTVAILGVSAGAIGGAFAFDQLASKYLWPAPEDVVVTHAQPASVTAVVEVREDHDAE